MPFSLMVNQKLIIGSTIYGVAAHPSAQQIPYGQEGRQATVYQLVDEMDARWALKVFKPRFRVPAMVDLATRIAPLAELSGLTVCRRAVLSARRHEGLLREHRELTYAMLMPWIEGPTWMEIVLEKRAISAEQSLILAQSLIEVLAAMEERGLAHCDLSGPNVLLPVLAKSARDDAGLCVELVDVEQIYGAHLQRPELLPSGSPGYAHRLAPDGLWGPSADRFAGTVIVAEILGWCDEPVREAAWGESYFDPQEGQQDGKRYQKLLSTLGRRWSADVAELFERAWRSEVLTDCATFGEWLVTLPVKARPIISVKEERERSADAKLEAQTKAIAECDLLWPANLAGTQPFIGEAKDSGKTEEDVESVWLFNEGQKAYHRKEWARAQELLAEVVRQTPDYRQGGRFARDLLVQTEQQLMKGQRRRWAWGAVAIVVILGLGGILIGLNTRWRQGVSVSSAAPTAISAATTWIMSTAPAGVTPTSSPTTVPTPTAASSHTATSTNTPIATLTLVPTTKPTVTPTPSPTQPPEVTRTGSDSTAVVTTNILTMRVGPDTQYARTGQVRQGDRLKILGRNAEGTWIKVTTEAGNEAWVILTYVQTDVDINSLPVIEALALPTPAPQPTTAPSGPTAPTRPTGFGYGVQAHEDTARVCRAINELGFGWLKQQVRWEHVEGAKGRYGWSGLDSLVDTANGSGVKVLFSVVAAPSWARSGKSGVGPPDNYQDFYDFMGAMAAHFRGRVGAYEIWNEQNLSREWEGAPLSASDYVRLLKGAYQAIKAADPNAIVISGAPTPTGISDGVWAIDDRAYLQQMYNAGLKYYCDAVGAHPSGYANPPDALYRGGDFDPSRDYDDHPSFFFRNTMEDYYTIMARNGDGAKRIWATEFGWPSTGGMGVGASPGYEFANDINEQQQANYIVGAYTWSRNWGHAGVMFLWNLNLWPTVGPENEMAKYSIVRGDWSPRPAYTALKTMSK